MSVRVEFSGGPADGTVQEYPQLAAALPSLLWQDGERGAVYRRADQEVDPVTGAWRYFFDRVDVGAGPRLT